jgi:hypothetical protein
MNGVANISGEDKALLAKAVKTLYPLMPSKFCGLNVAQYRALKAAYTPDKTSGLLPSLNIISFANGTGKSNLLILDMIGWTMGYEYLNYEAYPPCAIAHYASLKELRDSGLLSLRLVCASDDMKDGGSVNMLLKEFFPLARMTAVDQMRCYRQIDVPHPDKPGVVNSIAVKTFDQSEVKHSGSTCNRIWINEPLPENLVGETVGRIRSKKGGLQGSIFMCATLLDGASWVQELEDSDLRINLARGHIYENCAGEDVDDKMAAEVKQTIGVTLVKNPQGAGHITNGVLSKSQIDTMCAIWKKTCPDELEARKCGAPISGGGRIYPGFRRDIHVIEEYKVNPEWPIAMIADPHGARPTFIVWAQITPQDRVIIFHEWPDIEGFAYYETLDERKYTVPQECEIWDRIEQTYGIKNSNITRVGDPNRFRDHNPYSGQTLHALYAKHGYQFNLNVCDDLAMGHAKTNEYLYCDDMRLAANPNDVAALPRLFVVKKCVNVIRALENYAFKKGRRRGASVTENVNEKYKDGADVVRYLTMWHSGNAFSSVSDKVIKSSDYKRFCEGRIPKVYRKPQFAVKGRRGVA